MGGLGTHTRTLARPCAQPNAHAQCTRILTCAHSSPAHMCRHVPSVCACARRVRTRACWLASMSGMLGAVWCGCAQAEIAARRRAETMAANQLKLLEERTELARKTLKIDYSSLGISSLPKVPDPSAPNTHATYTSYIRTLMPASLSISIY